MKTIHTLLAAAALLAFSNVQAQRADAGAMFEGRPAMAGAQAGTGAMAGPPQGGIGVQGQDNAGIALRPPAGLRDLPQGTVDPAADAPGVNRSVRNNRDIVPRDRDTSIAKEQRSATKKAKRAVKNTTKLARHGVATIGE